MTLEIGLLGAHKNLNHNLLRKLILPATDHIFELLDHSVLLESANWFRNSLNCSINSVENPRKYPGS